MPATLQPYRRRDERCRSAAAIASVALALASRVPSARALGQPCDASTYAAQQFVLWDTNGDGYISKAEAEAYIARTVLGLPSLAAFPEFRYEVRAQHTALDTSAPAGLDLTEFDDAAWVRCAHTCVCDDVPSGSDAAPPKPARGSGARRGLQGDDDDDAADNGDDVPGATIVPGLWSSVASLEEDGLYAVRQMTLFNSNQLRAMVKAWVDDTLAPVVGDPAALAANVLQAVICGGVGLCAPWQMSLISGVGGILGAFVSLATAFFSKLVLYLVPSFSLVQTFQLSAAFEASAVGQAAAEGGTSPADSDLDLVALLHVVPGESAMINRFLSRTAKLPLMPSVAVARFSHDGGFELSFSLPRVTASPGGMGADTSVISLALQDQAVGMVTAYHTLLEFDDVDGDGVYSAANDTVGTAFALGEMAWNPIVHATSDGSCLTETDLDGMTTSQLVALCVARALPLCTLPSTGRDELIAYLEQNPIGCPVDVDKTVMIAVESTTKPMDEHPDFQLALSFVTSTAPLQDEQGALIGPNRAKVNVEIRGFPYSLPAGPRRKLGLRVAHAGVGALVDMGAYVDGPTIPDWELPDGFPSIGSVLDGVGNIPDLPSYSDLPTSLPGGIDLPDLPDVPDLLDFGFGGDDDDDDEVAVQSQRLAMVGSNVVETRPSLASAAPSAAWAAAAVLAAQEDPSVIERARALWGGDVVAQLLSEGVSLPTPPEGAFALSAYSTWQEVAFTERDSANATCNVYASALGVAEARIGWLAGVGAHIFASANASASVQWAVFETSSDYILWDPAVGVGERMEARKARADVAAAAAGGGGDGGGGGGGNAPPDDNLSPDQSGADGSANAEVEEEEVEGAPGISGTAPWEAPTFGSWLAANWLLLIILVVIVLVFSLLAVRACRAGRASRKRAMAAAADTELAAADAADAELAAALGPSAAETASSFRELQIGANGANGASSGRRVARV